MPPTCAASSRLALSTVLRNILRAEVASEVLRDSSSGQSAQNADEVSASAPNESGTAQPQKVENTTVKAKDQLDLSSQNLETDEKAARSTIAGESSAATETAGRSAKDAQKRKSKDAKPSEKKPEGWQIQKAALKEKFKEGWSPPKKLSPDALELIRHLHSTAPDQFTTPVLAEQFKVSPEAIRRILKSKWRPTEGEMEDRRRRWQRRHDRIWSQMAELGLRPKKKKTAYASDVQVLYDRDGPKPL
ncbi:hypothetical protein VTN00DRAFT_6929 [Thermoascus crustaceus]|uniref:uncharacterized protein n=1 Tax=Thermoascus crustaceus TaxID=5088 RepID=UPI003742EC1E